MEIYIISLIVVYVSSGALLGMFLYAELTKKKYRRSRQEAVAAYTDALTGLGNRYRFNRVMAEMVKHTEKKFSLCFLDLDDFKQINDNMGHDAGDELLVELGRRLKESIFGKGEVFRLGGDEYAIIIVGASSKLEVETIVKRIQRSVVKPVHIRNTTINLEYSLGIACFPEDSVNANELINFADAAMYFVKESGKSNYYFHNDALKAQSENNRRMENELKLAYSNNEFGIHYQPRIDIKNTKKVWLEAFLYWKHPLIGELRAAYFLKYAEATGLVISLDQYIIKESLKKIAKLNANGNDNVYVAINVSLRHFQRKDFVEQLCSILEENKEVTKYLMLQITGELDMSKVETYKVMFEKIKKYKVKLSINYFNINYEKLDLLKRLDVDEIKLSAEFLDSNSIFKKNVLKDIVALSKDLGYDILINRVSDEETYNEVVKYPVNCLQGNYIYPVIKESEIEKFLFEFREKEKKTTATKKVTKKTTN